MALKAKHAHGSRKTLESAIDNKIVDNFDVLFLSGEGENPAIGWIDKNGNPIILSPADEVTKLETEVEAKFATKADAEEVAALENEVATKASAEEVEAQIGQAMTDTVASAKAYTDGKIEAAINEHLVKKYELTSLPEGSLVDYRDKEIRVMCPADAKWAKQNVGAGGDANCYYATFKTYVFNDDAVGYIEHLGGQSDSEILTTFSTDEYGRRYQPTWLAIAKYDEATDTWTYYGKNSSANKYIGWDYQIDWYNADGVMIESDCVRINLSNEQCHYSIEPYYVSSMKSEIDTKIEEKIKEVETSYKIVEF